MKFYQSGSPVEIGYPLVSTYGYLQSYNLESRHLEYSSNKICSVEGCNQDGQIEIVSLYVSTGHEYYTVRICNHHYTQLKSETLKTKPSTIFVPMIPDRSCVIC
jgi:hypothetical protein